MVPALFYSGVKPTNKPINKILCCHGHVVEKTEIVSQCAIVNSTLIFPLNCLDLIHKFKLPLLLMNLGELLPRFVCVCVRVCDQRVAYIVSVGAIYYTAC